MDNIDSPFHRMVESELDRKIKANKTRFVEELQPRIKANPNIFSVDLKHIELSTCLFMEVGVTAQSGATYLLKMQYELDKHTFNVPRCFIFDLRDSLRYAPEISTAFSAENPPNGSARDVPWRNLTAARPDFFAIGGVPYSYDFSAILFQNPEMGTLLREIMQATFEVSKMPGFGTRRGDNWITDESSVQLANEALYALKITC